MVSTEKLKTVFNSIIDDVFTHGLEGNLLQVNECTVGLFDYSSQELSKINPFYFEIDNTPHYFKIRLDELKNHG